MQGWFRQRKTKLHKSPFSAVRFHFTIAQIDINCSHKYALYYHTRKTITRISFEPLLTNVFVDF